MGEEPASLIGVGSKILQHVFVDLFLQIDAHRSVRADDLVGANARVGWDVSTGGWNSDIGRNVADRQNDAWVPSLLRQAAAGNLDANRAHGSSA
jgi:hypothetical protein